MYLLALSRLPLAFGIHMLLVSIAQCRRVVQRLRRRALRLSHRRSLLRLERVDILRRSSLRPLPALMLGKVP
jgi:hypothetical protein